MDRERSSKPSRETLKQLISNRIKYVVKLEQSGIHNFFLEDGLTQKEIAKKYGVVDRTVRNWMARASVSVRDIRYSKISNENLEKLVKSILSPGLLLGEI